jgi:MFS transporter, SHS family, sialic acid transporter
MDAIAGSNAPQRGRTAALVAALLGWLFDGFEMGLFPLVGPRALEDLLGGSAGNAVATSWFGSIMAVFLVGAACGGVLFGWLGDRIGRVRAMSLSILTYAIFTGLCGLARTPQEIAAARFIASLGMGGEWALGVALVSELWPDASRPLLAGLIGAAANAGYLLVALVSILLSQIAGWSQGVLGQAGLSAETVDWLTRGDAWRLLMMAGAVPGLLVFFIRMAVPESARWEESRAHGGTSHWATRDLLGVLVGSVAVLGIVGVWMPGGLASRSGGGVGALLTLLLFAVALGGFLLPVLCYLRRAEAAGAILPAARGSIVRTMLAAACLSGVALMGTWGSTQWIPKWAIELDKAAVASGGTAGWQVKETAQMATSTGAIVGTLAVALLAGRFGRRIVYAGLCLASLATIALLYRGTTGYGWGFLGASFLAATTTAGFYGWFPLALPELFPTVIRTTAQGFAFNFGRVLAAVGSLQTAPLIAYFSRGLAEDRAKIDAFPRAGLTLSAIYLVGFLLVWLIPETKGKPLPE